jgi:uncharacterized protein YkwD
VLCMLAVVPVVAFTAIYVARSTGIMPTGLTQNGHPQAAARHGRSASPPARTVSTPGTPGASPSATPSRARRHRHHAARPHATASPTPTTSSSTSPSPSVSTPPPSQEIAVVTQVLNLINQARAQADLPLYSLSSGLDTSAAAHNARMAAGCGLSHQCPGEPPLGTRETDAGVNWTSAGENIGEGGPVADTTAAIAQMALGLTQDMLNEQPPNDGHRLNLLSSSFQNVGIAVFRDSSGTVWMTQDFSN